MPKIIAFKNYPISLDPQAGSNRFNTAIKGPQALIAAISGTAPSICSIRFRL